MVPQQFCMQKAAGDALSAFSLQLCMQEAAGDAVYTFSQQFRIQKAAGAAVSALSQQFCMQEAAGDVVYTFPQQFCRQKAAGDAVSTFSMQCCMQEAAEEALSLFSQQLNTQYTANMTAKLGLQKYDKEIAVELLTNMYEDKTGVQPSLQTEKKRKDGAERRSLNEEPSVSRAAQHYLRKHLRNCQLQPAVVMLCVRCAYQLPGLNLGIIQSSLFSTCMLCLWILRPTLQSARAAQQQLLPDVIFHALVCRLATWPCDVPSGCLGLLSLICHLADFTNTFRSLASVQPEDSSDELPGPLQEVGLPILAFPMSPSAL